MLPWPFVSSWAAGNSAPSDVVSNKSKTKPNPPPQAGRETSAAFGFPSPRALLGEHCWNYFLRPEARGILQAGAAPVQCPRHSSSCQAPRGSSASSHTHSREQDSFQSHRAAQGELESPGWGWLERFSSVRRPGDMLKAGFAVKPQMSLQFGGCDGALGSHKPEVWAVQQLMTSRVQAGWRYLTSNISCVHFIVSEKYRLRCFQSNSCTPTDCSWDPAPQQHECLQGRSSPPSTCPA